MENKKEEFKNVKNVKADELLKELKETISSKKLLDFTNEELEHLIQLPFYAILNQKGYVSAGLQLVPRIIDLKATAKNSSGATVSRFNVTYYDTIRALWGYPETATSIVRLVPVRFFKKQVIGKDGNYNEIYYYEARLAPGERVSGLFDKDQVKNLKTRYFMNKFELKVSEKTYLPEDIVKEKNSKGELIIRKVPFIEMAKDDDFLDNVDSFDELDITKVGL